MRKAIMSFVFSLALFVHSPLPFFFFFTAGLQPNDTAPNNYSVTKITIGGAGPEMTMIRGAVAGTDGLIAILPFSDYNTLHIYTLSGDYCFSFFIDGGAGGSFDMEWNWDTDEIVTYWSRNEFILAFDLEGTITFTGFFSSEDQNRLSQISANQYLGVTVLPSGEKVWTEAPPIAFPNGTMRAKVIRMDLFDQKEVIYCATLSRLLPGLCVGVIALLLILFLALLIDGNPDKLPMWMLKIRNRLLTFMNHFRF